MVCFAKGVSKKASFLPRTKDIQVMFAKLLNARLNLHVEEITWFLGKAYLKDFFIKEVLKIKNVLPTCENKRINTFLL